MRVNKNGEIYWRCKLHYNYKCTAHLKTLGDIIVSHPDEEHNHQGNISTSLAHLAVGKMKKKWKKHVQHQLQMSELIWIIRLQALPKKTTLTRILQRHRKAALADNGTVLLGWHYGLQSLFQCHHPNLWIFLDGISKDIQKQKAIFYKGSQE